MGSDTAVTNWDHPVTSRDHIRIRFRQHGQQYFVPDDPQTFPVALQYVPPMFLPEPLVKWWLTPWAS